jgi:peptidoglycan/xylan/chitin deacetylase (PgdA/CDA1 family)
MIPKPLIGPKGNTPILLRDDDTNYFTDERMLESVYSEAWNQGFKVSISVIPFQMGINDIAVPPGFRTSNKCYSIADNESLVEYIRKKIDEKVVEVVQHGLSHELIRGIRGEFGGTSGRDEEIEKGRNIIKKAFKTEPKFFVPPGEDISKPNLMAVLKQGLVPIYRETLFDRILRCGYVPNFVKSVGMKLVMNTYNNSTSKNYGVQFIKPVLISARKNALTWSLPNVSTSHITSFDSLFSLTNSVVKLCRHDRAPVCIINHYHLYYHDWSSTITKGELFKVWRDIVSTFDKVENAWKTTFLELYNRLEKIRSINITKSGSKITIRAGTLINDFSFQTRHPLESNSMVTSDEIMNIATINEVFPDTNYVFYEKN